MMAWAWERRNAAHVLLVRWGAGSTPAWWRISQTVDAATFTPRTRSSPWILRYPQVVFSRARRSTSRWIDRTVRGRPTAWGRERRACRRPVRSRCQRSTVSGRTSSCRWFSTPRGSGCNSAASQARSARVNRTRSPCRCRSRTRIWCRSARISASLSRSLMSSSRSRARVLVTPRYASRNSTPHRYAVLDVGEPAVIRPRGSASAATLLPR
jgi:hypothetical protein